MAQDFKTIASEIAERIKNGTYTDTLPSISRLSEIYGICPATVKRILSQLRDWKLVTGEHGRCVRINPKAQSNPYFHKNLVILADLTSIVTPFYAKTIELLSNALHSNYICIHVFLSEDQAEDCIFQPDCILTVSNRTQVMLDRMLAQYPDCPVVSLNQPSSLFPYVMSDGRKAGYEALRHLAEDCGHTHIGVLATQLQYPQACFHQRYEGALDYARKHPKIRLSMVEIPELELNRQTSYRLTGELFRKDAAITAVFATCDLLALGVYSYAAERHLDIPGDLAVIGFDNENFSQALTPPLSTLSENAQATAECLFRIILDLIMGRKTDKIHLTDPVLLVRGSTVGRQQEMS